MAQHKVNNNICDLNFIINYIEVVVFRYFSLINNNLKH